MKKGLLVVGWLICSYINWGLTLGFFDHEFPYMSNTGISAFTAAVGPFGTIAVPIVVVINGDKFRWRVKPPTTEERWKVFQERYHGVLDRAYFDEKYN
jgi:hypothetical protein